MHKHECMYACENACEYTCMLICKRGTKVTAYN